MKVLDAEVPYKNAESSESGTSEVLELNDLQLTHVGGGNVIINFG